MERQKVFWLWYILFMHYSDSNKARQKWFKIQTLIEVHYYILSCFFHPSIFLVFSKVFFIISLKNALLSGLAPRLAQPVVLQKLFWWKNGLVDGVNKTNWPSPRWHNNQQASAKKLHRCLKIKQTKVNNILNIVSLYPWCCVFRPAFGCCPHLKAGQNTFIQSFSTFFLLFSDFTNEITEKRLKMNKTLCFSIFCHSSKLVDMHSTPWGGTNLM